MDTESLSIRAMTLADTDAYVAHLVRHLAASGQGAPIYSPSRDVDPATARKAFRERMARPLDEPLWGRLWALDDPATHSIVGHVEIRGGRLPAELHRGALSMGIERAFVGRGWGTRLLHAAIAWARDEAALAWLDLGVFQGNEPALRLYRRAGFVEVGRVDDAFRDEDGTQIVDIHMTLALAPP